MYNYNRLWLTLMLLFMLEPCHAHRARCHAPREYAYLFADDGFRQYQVGRDGRLHTLPGLNTVFRKFSREYDCVTVNAPRRAVYVVDTKIGSTQPDTANRLHQYHISHTGVLVPMRPPVILTHPDVYEMAVVPSRPIMFAATDDYLEAYRVAAGGTLHLIHTYPKKAGYSLDSVAALTPNDLLVFGTDSIHKDVTHWHVVLHYQIGAGGTLRALPNQGIQDIPVPSDFSVSLSGHILYALCGAPGPSSPYSPAVAVYPIRAGRDFLAEPPAVTLLQPTKYESFATLTCTDRFVFCGLTNVGGPVETSPSASDVESYRLGADRHLTLISKAAGRPADRPIPYVDAQGRFLYIVGGAGIGKGTVDAYRIGSSGRLTLVQSLRGFGTISTLKFALLTRP